MAHEISTVSGRAECFTAGQLPWHKLGVNVPDRLNSAEAIRAAGLDWEVFQQPVEFISGGARFPISDKVANVRYAADGSPVYLATVGDGYKVIQNRAAFGFFDAVVGEGKAIYETAGAIREGRKVWILAKLPDDLILETPGGVDVTKQYLLFVNSHDATAVGRMFYTPVRVVCNNTLNAALSGAAAGEGVAIRHTGEIDRKMEEAVRILNIANAHYADLGRMFRAMVDTTIGDVAVAAYWQDVMPDRSIQAGGTERMNKRTTEIRSEFNRLYQVGDGAAAVRGTVWGAYNAVTAYADHTAFQGRKQRHESSRFESIMWGGAAELKQRAFNRAVEMVTGAAA